MLQSPNKFKALMNIALFVFFLTGAMIFLTGQVWAAGELSIEIMNGYNLVVDSNVTAPPTYAPKSAYMGVKICNTGDTAIEDITAYVGDYIDGSSDTPGIFPVLDSAAQSAAWDTAHPHIVDTGDYSLTIEADETGAADGTRYIGTLDPGECRVQYWLFSYPQCVNVDADGDGTYEANSDVPPCDVSITGGIKPEDDLTLDYDIWATTSTAGVSTVAETRDFTMRNEISASANKIWPNTDSKVPDEYLEAIESVIGWGTLGPDGQPLTTGNPVYPGQRVITTQGIWYDLGNVVHGFDNDNDLVVDQNAWLQPVGDPGLFDADCFRMVRNYGIVIVKLKSGGELLIPFEDELYFMNLPDNTGVVGLVYYQFIATDEGCSANMTPYQEAASGYDNEKFSSDYGLGLELYSGSFGTAMTLSKTDGVAFTSAGSTLTYTMTASNINTNANLGAPDLGVPLVFQDSIPAGTTYVASSASTSLTTPSGTGSYTQGYTDRDDNLDECTISYQVSSSAFKVFYSDDNGTSWSTTEPAAASVTDIRWMLITEINLDGSHDGDDCVAADGTYDDGALETSLPAGMSTTVTFQATVDSDGGPVICNTVGLGFGEADSSTEAEDCTLVTGNNTLSGTVFEDDAGTTGTYGNGTQDGDEAGIGNATDGVTVTLYYDFNGDGELDSNDIQYGTTSADANGDYSFTNLPDGPFLVVTKKYDGATSDSTDNAVNDFDAGWGNTTSDPDLALTTDQGILKMTEDSTTVTLAVNIDLDGSDATAQTISIVDFGFAPPLEVTKGISGSSDTVDEGRDFSYSVILENRLPGAGVQGPTGCEFTEWSQSGTNGSPTGKSFTDFSNAFDASAPNRSVASALITGGANRFVVANGFDHSTQPGNITKVEALVFAYYNISLDDDSLKLEAELGGSTVDIELSTAKIESYIGEPEDTSPNSAISWNITSLRPGGGSWSWSDFASLGLTVDPTKAAAADTRTFYLDAIGIRVTTDVDCEAGESTTLSPVPLEDDYDASRFDFISADPVPTSVNTTTGVIEWDDVGPILPGNSVTVTVTLRPKDVTGLITGTCVTGSEDACNEVRTDYSAYNVYYADGRLANDDNDSVPVNIQGRGEIRGTVWSDANNDGWPDNDGEAGLPNVPVSLYTCLNSDQVTQETNTSNSKTCEEYTSGNYWGVFATTVTDSNGDYEFLGLTDGYYIVEINDADGEPSASTGGNSAPYGSTQTAEPDDDQSTTSGNADAPTQGTFNNTWGSRSADLKASEINLLDGASEETINGVDFGYYQPNAVIYGNVWHDVNGDATTDPGDDGLSGFTVELYNDTDGDGDPDGSAIATTTTNASGDYDFSDLSADDYVVVVTPSTLLTQVWAETVESTGGTGSLNNQIPVTVSAGEFSGSHDFGYTYSDTASIGDTLYIDFDGDGIQGATEDPIANITVWLYSDEDRDGTIDDGVDVLLATDVTDSNGNYLFEDLENGSYIVKVDTTDSDFPTSTTATADPDTNAASIGDQIWLDADGDGTFDAGEEGIPNVVVVLYEDTNGNGSLDTGTDNIVAATSTDINGNYLFTALNAGGYFVDVDETSLPDSDLSITTTDPATVQITLSDRTSSTSVLTADAGYSPSTNYAIGNQVWYDDDYDNVFDAGESGIGGVDITVQLASCYPGCGTQYTTTTDESGYWMITGLSNGTYRVSLDKTDLISGLYVTDSGVTEDGTNQIDYADFTISGADDMSADFGYKYDPDNDANYTEDAADEPTGTIDGTVFTDSDGDQAVDSGEEMSGVTVNLFDEDGNLVATTTTAADGTYTFSGVPIGIYSVQAIDSTGTRYSTLFLSPGEAFSDMNVIFNETSLATPDSQSSVSVSGVYANLMQDFGYQRFLGAIGDTVYLDVNENSDQDFGEPGISGVTVDLYLWNDGDSDGVIDSGELTQQDTTTTTADDPLTAEDESGKYLFPNLDDPPAGQYYVVQVDTSTLPGTGYTLIGDPDTDGVPCPLLPDPDVVGDEFPAPGVCDSLEVADGYSAGINYLGADFGYQITGDGFAAIGDHVWIDADDDGVVDSGESGIPSITVYFDDNNDGTLDWADGNSNGGWDTGEGERWVETDSNGYYVFTEMANGTYNYLKVDTSDSDWPSGLTQVYEAQSGNDDSLDGTVNVIISSGAVSSIVDGDDDTSDVCTGCDLNVDFGYRYTGDNLISGTFCIDDPGADGYCGVTATTYSGVDTSNGEVALSGVTVYFYRWTDDGDNQAWDGSGTVDTDDTFTFLGSSSTDASGDYSFDNLPDDIVAVFAISESNNFDLNTTDANSSVEGDSLIKRGLFEGTTVYDGNTVTVLGRQALQDLDSDVDNDIKDLDFAFDSLINYDYGDLPDSGTPDYDATLLSSGARHVVTGTSIHMGAGVTTESNGTDSATASADGNDDGVSLSSTAWTIFTNAEATVNASDDGWVLGWIDFNQDGDFNDSDEQVANQAVVAGDNTISFYVPGMATNTYTFNARFRIYPEEPLLTSYTGPALSSLLQPTTGEVEDYQWSVSVTYVLISDIQAYHQGDKIIVEWETAAEISTRGFNLQKQDSSGKLKKLNKKPIPSVITPHGGVYQVLDPSGELGGTYAYQIEELQASGGKKVYGPYTLTVAENRQSTDAIGLPADSEVPIDLTQDNYASTPRGMDKLVYDPDYKDAKKESKSMKIFNKQASKSKSKKKDSPVIDVPETYDEIKIIVSETGFYWVGADTVADIVGIELETVTGFIANNQVRMSNMGKQVAYLPAEDLSGIYFYGESYTSIYTDENVYWIQLQSGAVKGDVNGDGNVDEADLVTCMDVLTGKVSDIRSDYAASGADVNGNNQLDMNEVAYIRLSLASVIGTVEGVLPTEPVEGRTFTVSEHFEEDTYWRTAGDFDTDDFWFWEQFWSGNPIMGIRSFPIEVSGVAVGDYKAKLTVNLQGLSNSPHQLVATLNAGTANELLLGSIAWDGFDPKSATFEITQENLFEGANTINIQGVNSGEVMEALGVDSFDVTYQRTYIASDNSLVCNSSDNELITISGFTSSDIALFEISDPAHPKRVAGAGIDNVNGTVTFIPSGENIAYLAVGLDTQKSPDAMIYDEPSDLKSDQNSAQYIVITADELADGAQKLAAYRETRGLSTKVAKLTDVFDEFSGGIYDPFAIREFIAYALSNWSSAPQYVVLVGHGTYDFKEVLKRFSIDLHNLMPVVMTKTPYGTFGFDNLYGDVDGDSLPDVALGRIPAKTNAQVQAVVAKIAAYEASLSTPDKQVIMLADKPDTGPFNDFPGDSDNLATLIAEDYTVEKIYYPGLSKTQMRDQFVSSVNNDSGAFLVNYIGHGGFDRMSDFFTTGNLDLLQNSQYPIYVGLSCLVNGFDFPFIDSFGESLMLRDGSGAIASWASIGLSVNKEAVKMNQELFRAIFTENAGDLGHAVKQALKRYHDSGPLPYPYMIRIYNLLGDPALELN